MTITRTFGRLPTLAEMNEYYAREDVLDFLCDECQRRNIDIAFRRKRWPIKPTSKAQLREIIVSISGFEQQQRDYCNKFRSSESYSFFQI